MVKESRERRKYMGRQPSRWVMFGYAARHPVVGRLMLLTFAVGVAFTAIESTFALWAQHRFGWVPRDIGLCFGITGAVSACCQFLLTGPLSRRFGEGNMLAVGMAGSVICTALQPFSDGGFFTVTLMALMALSQSVAFPNSGALLSRSVDPDHQGQIMGLNNATGALARVTGPQFGLGLQSLNINGAFYFGARSWRRRSSWRWAPGERLEVARRRAGAGDRGGGVATASRRRRRCAGTDSTCPVPPISPMRSMPNQRAAVM